MKKKKGNFQLDIRLGLALIILVLMILNFASHYTLYRVKQSVESQLIEELTEAALVVSNKMAIFNTAVLNDSVLNSIKIDFSLQDISLVHFNFERAMAVQMNKNLDNDMLRLDKTLTADKLKPLLSNEFVLFHKHGSARTVLMFPTELAGSKYIIAVEKSSSLLSSLENARSVLIFSILLGISIIMYATMKFVRRVLLPFKKLKEKAEKSGKLQKYDDEEDEIAQLVISYEKIIDDLKSKESELVELNRIITEKAEHLEVHNDYILRSINTGIITLNTDNIITTINPAVAGILKSADETLVESEYQKALENYPELLELIKRFLNSKEKIINETTGVAIDSEERILSVTISHLCNKNNRKIGYSVILNDQTDFIELQDELEQKKRMAILGEMSGGLAHQLRNSIGGIVGFARLIERKISNSAAKKNVANLLKESGEAESLVRRFLDFASPLEPQLLKTDIYKIINELIDSVGKKYSNVNIEFNTFDESLIAECDALLIKQAIGNIINNACNVYDGKKGKVEIKTDQTKDNLVINIKDTGPGIPDAYHDKIFAPFFSGSPSGTGLGLPLAKKIIILHGGRLEFDTGDWGTRFIITMPLNPQLQLKNLSKVNI